MIIAAPRPHQRNLRRIRLARLDEKILADPHRLPAVNARDVINAVLVHLDGAAIDIILAARQAGSARRCRAESGRPAAAGRSKSAAPPSVPVTARKSPPRSSISCRHSGPRREMIRHANLLHRRQIGDANIDSASTSSPRRHVILNVLRQTRKQKLIPARETPRPWAASRSLPTSANSETARYNFTLGDF